MSWEVGKLKGKRGIGGRCLGSKGERTLLQPLCDPSDGGFLNFLFFKKGQRRQKENTILIPSPHPHGAFWERGWDHCGVVEARGRQAISGTPGARFVGEAEAAATKQAHTCSMPPGVWSLSPRPPGHCVGGWGCRVGCRAEVSKERYSCSRDPMTLFD